MKPKTRVRIIFFCLTISAIGLPLILISTPSIHQHFEPENIAISFVENLSNANFQEAKKIMRTRVFGFIAIFNFIFAFGKDNKRWAQRQTENSFPIWLCRTESHLRIYKDSNFFNGLRKKSYKRNMDLIYLYNL